MLPYRDSRITVIILGIFLLAVIGYAGFELRGLLFGPRVEVAVIPTPTDIQAVTVRGTTTRATKLTLDGADVAVTMEGTFEVPYLLVPGLNTITLDATDSYGTTDTEVLQVVYTGEVTMTAAGTTTATSTDEETQDTSDLDASMSEPPTTTQETADSDLSATTAGDTLVQD